MINHYLAGDGPPVVKTTTTLTWLCAPSCHRCQRTHSRQRVNEPVPEPDPEPLTTLSEQSSHERSMPAPTDPSGAAGGQFACVVDEHPRFHLDALRWYAALTALAGVKPSDLVVHAVGSDVFGNPRIPQNPRSHDTQRRALRCPLSPLQQDLWGPPTGRFPDDRDGRSLRHRYGSARGSSPAQPADPEPWPASWSTHLSPRSMWFATSSSLPASPLLRPYRFPGVPTIGP